GIPQVNIECKSPTSLTENWFTAYKQIKDYEESVPELYKYIQIGVAAESIARYFPIVPWQDEVKIYAWKSEGKDSVDSTLEMLSPATLLDILINFLFFRVEFGEATKVITRYMQYRATNKMVNRVIANLRGEKEKENGLIWHWQGSGKTLTMIFAANKLFYATELEHPTIFFIVDRIDLEEQLYGEFNAMDIVSAEKIGSITKLKEVIGDDDYRGRRGVFITLMHKFRQEELKEFYNELERVSQQKETIRERKNVIAFVDEGHRTQYGLLAAQRNAILQNAFFFALTGTPISKKGKDTYVEFSYPPSEPYLDRYFITDSIRDGFTVKIVYQPRLEKEVHLKKEMLEGFLESEFQELPEEIREEVEEKTKKKLNVIRVVLENPERIETIAKDIAEHFKENLDGKFKAMVVAPSRKACALYKIELDRHLPVDYSEIVMTYNERQDESLIRDRIAETKSKYGQRDLDEIRKQIIENFKEEKYPKILIVTDMLLTGFDAPILQTMYLHKPLKEHRLLQAVARTNRPYNDVKEAGMIIDYVGVLGALKRALEIYSEQDLRGALIDYASLREEFIALIEGLLEMFEEVPKDYERQTLLSAIEVLTSDAEDEKMFIEKYRTLRRLFELLGPNEIKLNYSENYRWLSAVYTYYRKLVLQKVDHDEYVQKYYEKTVKFIHESTGIDKLEKELPVIAFDEEYLTLLQRRVKSKKE
ncbi:MAG: HsdR family type I site-specific deoxyribonuclease, partial [Thermodesulfobacteriota bacterium]